MLLGGTLPDSLHTKDIMAEVNYIHCNFVQGQQKCSTPGAVGIDTKYT